MYDKYSIIKSLEYNRPQVGHWNIAPLIGHYAGTIRTNSVFPLWLGYFLWKFTELLCKGAVQYSFLLLISSFSWRLQECNAIKFSDTVCMLANLDLCFFLEHQNNSINRVGQSYRCFKVDVIICNSHVFHLVFISDAFLHLFYQNRTPRLRTTKIKLNNFISNISNSS